MQDIILDTEHSYMPILTTPMYFFVLSILSMFITINAYNVMACLMTALLSIGNLLIAASAFKISLDIRTKEEMARIKREEEERLAEARRRHQDDLKRMQEEMDRRKRDYDERQRQQQRAQYTYRGRPIYDDPFVYDTSNFQQPTGFPKQILDCFTLMGIKPTRDLKELKKIYRQKAKECHPDTPNGNAERFKNLTRYYDAIRNYLEAS
jgi:hypothetical protein